MHEGRPNGGHRKARIAVHGEEGTLRRGFVLYVRHREVVGSKGCVLAQVQPSPVRRDAQNEDVPLDSRSAAPGRGLDLGSGGAMLPVVGEVENGFEWFAPQDPGHGLNVAPVRLDVPDHSVTEVVVIAPVKHRDVVTEGEKTLHGLPTHELGAANDKDSHV